MPNKNYIKGRKKEYKIIEQLRKEGYQIAQRSASSKSCVDIWAVRKQDNKILLVQAKPKSMSNNAKNKLLEKNNWLTGYFDVEFVVL